MIDNPPPPVGYEGPDWYASPTGKTNGNGSIAYPWDLQTALDKSATILPGQTLWLRGGTYSGDFTCSLAGETDNRVVVRPYPGETPIIDGALELGLLAEWVKLWVPTIINTTEYRGLPTDPDGANVRPTGINLLAPDCEIIGGKIIDSGVSIGSWAAAHGTKIYGVLCLNGGWVNYPAGTGHAIYAQNETGERPVRQSIFGPHFGRTLALFGKGAEETEPHISGYRIDQCVFIERTVDDGSNLLIGGHRDCRLDDIEFTRNHVLGPLQAQYLNTQSGSVIISDNTFWSRQERRALVVGFWEAPTITGNVINGKSPLDDVVIQEMICWIPPIDIGEMVNTWDDNEYHYTGEFEEMYRVNDNVQDYRYDFTEWQAATGFDAASSYDEVDTLPDSATVWPNEYKDEYDKRCGIVVIWNGSGLDSVDVDLASLSLTNGATYQIIQALDPLVDITTFEYSTGVDVTFDMRASEHTLANPVGWPNPLTNETFPRFGAFLIEEV